MTEGHFTQEDKMNWVEILKGYAGEWETVSQSW